MVSVWLYGIACDIPCVYILKDLQIMCGCVDVKWLMYIDSLYLLYKRIHIIDRAAREGHSSQLVVG